MFPNLSHPGYRLRAPILARNLHIGYLISNAKVLTLGQIIIKFFMAVRPHRELNLSAIRCSQWLGDLCYPKDFEIMS
jgi:hypothetical protein